MTETETDRHGTEMYRGHPVEDIEEGEKFMESPISGNTYRVTKWVDKGDGKFVAVEKELVDDEEVSD